MGDWSFRHSVVARVGPQDAWAFWTNVSNWKLDPSLEHVQLDGPFAAGTRGVSKPRGSEPLSWLIREVGLRTHGMGTSANAKGTSTIVSVSR